MTTDNQRQNVIEEMARADACLGEARTLFDAGYPYGAASRAYYAVFHAARSLLFSLGLELKSHRGVISLLGEHFIKPGLLAPEMGRLFSRMQRDREDADYMTGVVFTADEAAEEVAGAERFLAEARRVLGL